MIDTPKSDELARVYNDAVTGANPAIAASTIDTEGTYLFALRAGCIAMAQEVLQSHVVVARDALETTAKGARFDELLWARYRRKRLGASRALVTLTFTRSGNVSGSIPAGYKVGTAGGIDFEVALAVPFAPADTTGTVLARAVLAGPAGNVEAGTIRVLKETAFDPTMTVTNAAVAAGGTNAQTEDEALTTLALYLDSLTKGTLGAIEAAARDVPGVGKAVATEVALLGDDGITVIAYLTTLAITDPFGGANAALAAAVTTALREARSCGVPVRVLPAATVWQSVELAYSYLAGYDNADVDSRARAAVLNQINSLRLGEIYDPGATAELVRRVRGLDYRTVRVTFPTAPQETTAGQILRTTDSRIRVNGR